MNIARGFWGIVAVGLLLVIVSAAHAKYDGGSGTANDPYQIRTAEQMNAIGANPGDWTMHFKLMADIDLSGFTGKGGKPAYNIIGPDTLPGTWEYDGTPFTGVFDGNGHRISHLTIEGEHYVGLFGMLGSGAEVKDLGVVDVFIVGSGSCVGALAGRNDQGAVTACYSTGVVSATGVGPLGGLVGETRLGTLTQCYSTCAVSSSDDAGGLVGLNTASVIGQCHSTGTVRGGGCVGGLIGFNQGDLGGVRDCFSTGPVFGEGQAVGGLVGFNAGAGGLTHCYSTSAVTGGYDVGGLVGYNGDGVVRQCYSTGVVKGRPSVGGLVGHNGRTVTQSFWDMQTSGQAASAGGTGKTTVEMQMASTFLDAGWDFVGETANGSDDIWWILEGKRYPRFSWEFRPASSPDPADGAVDVAQPVVLQWKRGGPTLEHDVYFGDDREKVTSATPARSEMYRGRQATGATTYDPGVLENSKTYYWRVDEVDTADPRSVWPGTVWSFTVANYLVVDDFESYDDACNLIFYTWLDGFGYLRSTECGKAAYAGNGTGSTVEKITAPAGTRTVLHSGMQSLQLTYDNTAGTHYSQTERMFDPVQDWTRYDVNTLTVFFRGDSGNAADGLYVGVGDSGQHMAWVYHTDPQALAKGYWRGWDIAFTELTPASVDLTKIKKLVIGVGDRTGAQAGGKGKVYLDDLRLTKGGGSLGPVAWWEFEEGTGTVAADSAGGNDGTVVGASWVPGKSGTALSFDGINDYVTCGKEDALVPEQMTVSFWVYAEEPLGYRSVLGKAADMSWSREYTFTTDETSKLKFSFGEDMFKRVSISSQAALTKRQWVHVAATRDGATACLYLNGHQESSAAYTFAVTPKGQEMRIGSVGTTGVWAGYFKGRIDEVRIYDWALASEEIAQLAAGEL